MAEFKNDSMAVPLLPTNYVLHGDRYCWWLTKMKPKKDNPFVMIESDSLGYLPHIGDVLHTIPRKELASPDIAELKDLISAVDEMTETIKNVGSIINEKLEEIKNG